MDMHALLWWYAVLLMEGIELFSWYWCHAPSEKDLVMGMIKQALVGVDLSGHNQQGIQQLHAGGSSPPVRGPAYNHLWKKPQRTRSASSLDFSSDISEQIFFSLC